MLKNLLKYRPFADQALCHFLKHRLTLPSIYLGDLFTVFDQVPVTLRQLPRGGWSTPVADLVILLKLIGCTRPKKLLEVGSFRGYTALLWAEHVSPGATIVTVDRFPEHGEAYRNTEYARMIDRRVGDINEEMFKHDPPNSFDLIFIDADHTYEGVKRDTELMLSLVSKTGFILWHDYANWGYFNGYNGVPEYLKELSQTLPLAHISGSDIAIHSPSWSSEGKTLYTMATKKVTGLPGSDPWQTGMLRG